MSSTALKQSIQEAMKSAMKSQEKQRLAVIRLILAAIKQKEVDERVECDDVAVLAVLDKMSKQRRESISQYEAAGREDLASQERYEIEVIQTFMPEPLSKTELDKLVAEAISGCGATSIKDMGKVMAQLKPTVQGRADMTAVSALIKEKLSA